MLTVVLTWSILIWKQIICKGEFQGKGLYQFRNMVQKALSVSLEMFSVGNKRRIVPLPAAPSWTAGCITIKSLGCHEVHKVLEHLQAQMLSTWVRWEDHSLRGSNKRQREHVRLWCRALKALHITTQPLNLNYSDTPNTQKVSELVSERTSLDAHWAAMWHTESSPLWNIRRICVSHITIGSYEAFQKNLSTRSGLGQKSVQGVLPLQSKWTGQG